MTWKQIGITDECTDIEKLLSAQIITDPADTPSIASNTKSLKEAVLGGINFD